MGDETTISISIENLAHLMAQGVWFFCGDIDAEELEIEAHPLLDNGETAPELVKLFNKELYG